MNQIPTPLVETYPDWICAEHNGIHIAYIKKEHAAFFVRAFNQFENERAERYRLLHQLKKLTHLLKMRKERTQAENIAIKTADKAIAKAEGR